MLKVTATVEITIPHHEYCNLATGGLCRFCTSSSRGLMCNLYNEPLYGLNGNVHKCDGCLDSINATQTKIDDPAVNLEPKVLIKHAVDEYIRVYKRLRRNRYSENLSLSLAKEQVLDTNYTL